MKIAVTGKMRSGKDTVAKYFLENDHQGWQNQLAFGDEIKAVAKRYFPEIVAQGKPRNLYQTIGQDFRKIDEDVWVKALDRTMNNLISMGESNFIISDVRQMNEYKYLKENGFVVIKTEAHEDIRKERIIKSGDFFSEKELFHETELAVDDIPCDYLISNNTTLLDLYDQLYFIHNELKGDFPNDYKQVRTGL